MGWNTRIKWWDWQVIQKGGWFCCQLLRYAAIALKCMHEHAPFGEEKKKDFCLWRETEIEGETDKTHILYASVREKVRELANMCTQTVPLRAFTQCWGDYLVTWPILPRAEEWVWWEQEVIQDQEKPRRRVTSTWSRPAPALHNPCFSSSRVLNNSPLASWWALAKFARKYLAGTEHDAEPLWRWTKEACCNRKEKFIFEQTCCCMFCSTTREAKQNKTKHVVQAEAADRLSHDVARWVLGEHKTSGARRQATFCFLESGFSGIDSTSLRYLWLDWESI